MEYVVTQSIPVPTRKRVGARGSKYPFAIMVVGDSFFAPVEPQTLQACARRAAKDSRWAFTTRAETENGVDGARCWRKS